MGSWFSRVDGPSIEEIEDYCESIIWVKFYGQTSKDIPNKRTTTDGLGKLLKQLDTKIRIFEQPNQFKITEDFKNILKKISEFRRNEKTETEEDCYERFLDGAEQFQDLYRERNTISENLETETYWGTRQQLLFGKIVVEWLNYTRPQQQQNNEPFVNNDIIMDPIFGLLLNPTGGRTGPGDAYYLDKWLFDNYGHMAYHSAVHDAFGYLQTSHGTGPGYNYMDFGIFGDFCPLGGQYSGIKFWKQCLSRKSPHLHREKFFYE